RCGQPSGLPGERRCRSSLLVLLQRLRDLELVEPLVGRTEVLRRRRELRLRLLERSPGLLELAVGAAGGHGGPLERLDAVGRRPQLGLDGGCCEPCLLEGLDPAVRLVESAARERRLALELGDTRARRRELLARCARTEHLLPREFGVPSSELRLLA